MTKCIVTGGAGFIGSHVVDKLLASGHEVIVIDNFSTGRQQNLLHNKNNKRLKVIKADITDIKKIKPYFKNVQIVFHLAALADIVPSITNPVRYYQSNVMGTMCVMEAARFGKVKKIIYAASSSCYGIPKKYPTSENSPICARYPYALTKYLGEETVLHWGKVYKLPVVSLRLFNVYGLRSRTSGTYGAVFGIFLAQKLNNKPFTVVGDGSQTRDFIFATDVADAFYLASKSKIENEIMNVGSGKPQSVNSLVKILKGDIVYIPKRPGEPGCTHADISKIKKVLGWQPKTSFEKGVNIILENIKYWKKAPVWTAKKIKSETKEWFKYLG